MFCPRATSPPSTVGLAFADPGARVLPDGSSAGSAPGKRAGALNTLRAPSAVHKIPRLPATSAPLPIGTEKTAGHSHVPATWPPRPRAEENHTHIHLWHSDQVAVVREYTAIDTHGLRPPYNAFARSKPNIPESETDKTTNIQVCIRTGRHV